MATKFTEKQIQEMLAGMTVEQLTAAAKERELASIGPMVTEYAKTEDRLLELRLNIQKLNPTWEPPTLEDKVVSWVMNQDNHTATATAIRAEFIKRRGGYAMPVKNAMDKAVTNKRLTVDKNGNYTVSPQTVK